VLARVGAKQGKINAESGHMQRIQKIGCVLGGKIVGSILGRRMVENGHMDRICKMGGAAVSAIRHAEKDPKTGKSVFAARIGKSSGVTRGLMKRFCKEQGVNNPGTNFVNMDKKAFEAWRENHAG